METENLEIPLISTTTKSSSWPIIRGSLDDAITCESSFSAVDSTSDSDHAVDLSSKPPLIMRRSSPDSHPCEITISFTQQHEIRQIYVRSTARVYEIYYAADEKGDNQYLCTVRCGVAARMEELMQETDGVEALSTSSSSSTRSSCGGHFKSESGGSATTEDGWVDVKVQNSCKLNAGDGCLDKKDEICIVKGNQDFYEATAEISDVDPVQSVTLRLLSIQSGDYIYIDEVYVFADPVLSTDTNSSTNAKETSSSESATMSLLIPTLLNMSKLRRNQMQEQSDSAVGVRKHQDTKNKSNDTVMLSNTSKSERNQGTMLNGASVPLSQHDLPVQRLESYNNNPYTTSERNEYSCGRIEKTLDELVSRVSKIEQFCVRFEENMLKPISNVESRLERVEQQLESFIENAKSSLTACNRVSAPDFSCIESESHIILTGSNVFPGDTNSSPIKKDETHVQDMSISPLNVFSPVSVPTNDVPSSTTNQLTPGLVVTAPDFTYVDDEGEMDTFDEANDSPKSSPKKPLSVDDALASALAGFLSSASIGTDMVEEAADILCKEESGNTCLSELIQSNESIVPLDHINDANICGEDLVVTKQESFGAGNYYKDATDSVDDCNLLFTDGYSEKPLGNSDCDVASLESGEKNIGNLSVNVSYRTTNDDSNQEYVFGSSDSSANDLSVAVSGVATKEVDSTPGEGTSKECPDLLHILQLQKPAILDFGIPILDVKFSSKESSSAKSSFNTLLLDVPALHRAASCVEEDNAASFSERNDLVMIEDVNSTTSETPNSQLFCFDNYDSSCMPSDREEELPIVNECNIHDMDASLI